MRRFIKVSPILLLSCITLLSCVDDSMQIYEESAAIADEATKSLNADSSRSINVGTDNNGNLTLYNCNITSDATISGDNIFVENVSVSNGAILQLDAGTSITINKPFTIESGSGLIMTRGN